MKWSIVILMVLASMPFALATDLPPPPPQPDATEAIAKQIGWLVIQNANLQMQIEALKKQMAECGK